jgi:hypothetical protein
MKNLSNLKETPGILMEASMIIDAVDLLETHGKLSNAMLQRKLHINWEGANKLIQYLIDVGIYTT